MTETESGYKNNPTACIANQQWNIAEVYACALVGSGACPGNESCAVYRNHKVEAGTGPVSPAATGRLAADQDDI